MIVDPETASAETQRRVFLGVAEAIMAIDKRARSEGPKRPLDLGATIDGLLEVIAALLTEARVLPDEAAELQVCEDLRAALVMHLQQARAALAPPEASTRH